MLIEWFLSIKTLPNLLFGVLCLPGDQSHPFAQPTINPLACCICWAGLLGRAVFPSWNEGPNFGSYTRMKLKWNKHCVIFCSKWIKLLLNLTDFENIKFLIIPWKVRYFCSKPMKIADCCSFAELCPTLCDPMDCSMPGFPVLHHLWKFAQTRVHWCHPIISSSVVPFSSCLQAFPVSGSFLVS